MGTRRVVLAHGTVVDRRYRVAGLLGRGGMADVFRATDTATDRPVALKVLRSTDERDERRFRSEVEILARVEHPGLVRLCGAGSFGGLPYLVLDLVEGSSLADELDRGPLGVDRTGAVGVQVAEALAEIHRRGIVHRDVKPANVLVEASGRVRLADFGIARFTEAAARLTATGTVIGSAAYLAPEQLEGEAAGPPADVYALGLVLVECLTGRCCYPGSQAEAALARLRRPPAIPDDLPPWLHGVLRAATARDPECRPSAAAVAVALRTQAAEPALPATRSLPLDHADPSGTTRTAALTAPLGPRTGPGTGRGRWLVRSALGVVLLGASLAVGSIVGNRDLGISPETSPSPSTPALATVRPKAAPTTVGKDAAPSDITRRSGGEDDGDDDGEPADGDRPGDSERGNGNANGRGRGRR